MALDGHVTCSGQQNEVEMAVWQLQEQALQGLESVGCPLVPLPLPLGEHSPDSLAHTDRSRDAGNSSTVQPMQE